MVRVDLAHIPNVSEYRTLRNPSSAGGKTSFLFLATRTHTHTHTQGVSSFPTAFIHLIGTIVGLSNPFEYTHSAGKEESLRVCWYIMFQVLVHIPSPHSPFFQCPRSLLVSTRLQQCLQVYCSWRC